MIELMVHNLLAYSGQIAILIGIAALLSALLRLTAAVRLYSFQVLLALCLAIPFLQPWQLPAAKSLVTMSTIILSSGASSTDAAQGWRPSPAEIAIGILVAGMIVRVGFILLGLWRLRRYLDRAQFTPTAFPVEKERTGAWPDVFVSQELKGPVTFGLWRPVVLVPTRWMYNETIAYHELVHVRRRDWAFAVVEELVRAVLWFHPAVWWLIGQIQLSREEVVDRGAVQLMQSREQYIDTLLAIAEAKAGVDLAPATLFLKKRHLRQRVAALLKEVTMSQFRITSSVAGFAAVLALAGWMATRSFPLEAGPVQDSPGVTVQQDETNLLHRTAVRYPQSAIEKGVQGTVLVEASLDSKGEVSDAQVISGPQELRKAALESVLQWHYNMETGVPPKVQVAIDFALPSQGASAAKTLPAPASNTVVQRINIGTLPDALREKVSARLPIHIGDELTAASAQELMTSLNAIDEHLHATWTPSADGTGSVVNVFVSANPASAELSAQKRIRVGGNVQAMNLVNKVTPVYPPLAKQARVQGLVRFTAYIGKDGHIENLEVVTGDPLLVAAAQDAVKQWVYRPTLLNGDPVEVITQIDVNFTLAP